jgi:hypothetical protein
MASYDCTVATGETTKVEAKGVEGGVIAGSMCGWGMAEKKEKRNRKVVQWVVDGGRKENGRREEGWFERMRGCRN